MLSLDFTIFLLDNIAGSAINTLERAKDPPLESNGPFDNKHEEAPQSHQALNHLRL